MHFVGAKALLTGSLAGGNGMNVYRGCSHGCIYVDIPERYKQMTFEDYLEKRNFK